MESRRQAKQMLHRRIKDSSQLSAHELSIVNGPRVLRDIESGEITTVVERRADSVAGARGPTCLLFSTDRGFTRLWDYPANWSDLSDAELIALSLKPRRSQSA